MEYRLCPSILSADFNRLGEQIKILEEYKEYDWYKLPEREDIPNVKDKDKGKITTVSAFCEKYSEQESSASRERE